MKFHIYIVIYSQEGKNWTPKRNMLIISAMMRCPVRKRATFNMEDIWMEKSNWNRDKINILVAMMIDRPIFPLSSSFKHHTRIRHIARSLHRPAPAHWLHLYSIYSIQSNGLHDYLLHELNRRECRSSILIYLFGFYWDWIGLDSCVMHECGQHRAARALSINATARFHT